MYNQRNFKYALELFEDILSQDQDNNYVKLYTGLTYIELGLSSVDKETSMQQFNKAVIVFEELISTNDKLFEDQALWYLSLSYIRSGNFSDAETYLIELAQGDYVYKESAQELLKIIRK